MTHARQSGLAARAAALALIDAVFSHRQALSDAIEAQVKSGPFTDLSRRDRAFARTMTACVLRRTGQLNAVIGQFLAKPLPAKADRARAILLLGAAQILFLETPGHAAVNVSVQLANKDRQTRHFKGLINAVLRKVTREREALLKQYGDVGANTPAWLMTRWQNTYGNDLAEAIAAQHIKTPPLDITAKTEPEKWAHELGGKLLDTGSIRLIDAGPIKDRKGFEEGAWWVQDAAASLPVRLLGDVKGKTVLDLCAAPGGKTAQLAAAGAQVIAVDKSSARLKILKSNLDRLGLQAQLVCADATRFQPDTKVDAILLDAPCLATGTIRRNPDVVHLKKKSDLLPLARLQRALLDHALTLIRPGGTLVYCTCSLEPEEGVAQIAPLVSANRVRRVPVSAAEVFNLAHVLTPEGDLRSLPCQDPGDGPDTNGMDGFYAARLTLPNQT